MPTAASATSRALALFLSNNDNSAAINADGLVTSANPGEAFVMARFSTHTVGSQVIVLPAGASYTPPDEKPVNYIDELVGAKLRKLRIRPAGLCSDEVFLRRVSLDIAGRIPTRRRISPLPRRSRGRTNGRELIDRLLERKEFAEIWAMNWAELLMVHTTLDMSYKSVFLYSNWLTEQIAHNVPIDRMARELLTASGGTFSNPPTNFYQVEKDTLKTAGERGPGVHGDSRAVRAVPQPSLRPLDAGRLLLLRRVFRADRPQAGGGLPRDDRLRSPAAARCATRFAAR